MKLPFTKMHGIGNDYVYIDGFDSPDALERGDVLESGEGLALEGVDFARLAPAISDRRRGIGSDGVIVIAPTEGADARMIMYNADGSRSEMCGNGLRCVGKFLFDRGRVGREMTVETGAGVYGLKVEAEKPDGQASILSVNLGTPRLSRAEIPMTGPAGEVLGERFEAGGRELHITALSLGNPHCVIEVEGLPSFPVEELGPLIETDPRFPHRTNVEFITVRSPAELSQRTWERGSGETWACGSGAAASAVAAQRLGLVGTEVDVHLRGGDLRVAWAGPGQPVFLSGQAVETYRGVLDTVVLEAGISGRSPEPIAWDDL